MAIHVVFYCDEPDGTELVDVVYQCSAHCMGSELEAAGINVDSLTTWPAGGPVPYGGGSVTYGGWPGGSETDCDVECSACGAQLWEGLQP